MLYFLRPGIIRKAFAFLMLSGGVESDFFRGYRNVTLGIKWMMKLMMCWKDAKLARQTHGFVVVLLTPVRPSDVFHIETSPLSYSTNGLTLSWQRSLSYRNQSIDFQSKSMNWFLYDRDLRHERVKVLGLNGLTLFTPMSHFNTLWKRKKTFAFLTFSGGIEVGYLREKGQCRLWTLNIFTTIFSEIIQCFYW